jgi:nucleotide-binding universal stress UspA family protein
MIRDVLVHVTADEASIARVDYAVALAARHNARLSGVHVIAPPEVPPLFKPSLIEAVAHELGENEEAVAKLAERQFQNALAGHRVESRWFAPRGDMASGVCALARYADVVLVGHEPTEIAPQRSPFALADRVVLRSGRPVLILPGAGELGPPAKRALIAWDGRPQAVRAVHDALPFLVEAQVSLVVVANPEQDHLDPDVVDGGELLDHLRRHGVKVQSSRTLRLHQSDAAIILNYFRDQDADLLVMGGYGRAALTEALFGGATAHLVREAPGALLISH